MQRKSESECVLILMCSHHPNHTSTTRDLRQALRQSSSNSIFVFSCLVTLRIVSTRRGLVLSGVPLLPHSRLSGAAALRQRRVARVPRGASISGCSVRSRQPRFVLFCQSRLLGEEPTISGCSVRSLQPSFVLFCHVNLVSSLSPTLDYLVLLPCGNEKLRGSPE